MERYCSFQRRLRSVSGYHASGAGASGRAFTRSSPDAPGAGVVRGQSPFRRLGGIRSGCRPWVQGYGVSGNVDGDGNAAGCDYDIAGTTVGVDRRLDANTVFGLAGAYSHDWVGLGEPDQQASVDSGRVALYAHRTTRRNYATGLFAFAHDGYETTRRSDFGELARTALADYDGREFALRFEIGRFLARGGAQLQPYAALQYVHLRQDGFTETGAGSINLSVDGMTTDSLRSFLGSRVVWYRRFGGNRSVAPELHALWRHEFLDDARLVNADFLGAPGNSFVVAGADLGRDAASLGGACTFYLAERLSLFADYDLLLSDAQVTHAATGGAQLLW